MGTGVMLIRPLGAAMPGLLMNGWSFPGCLGVKFGRFRGASVPGGDTKRAYSTSRSVGGREGVNCVPSLGAAVPGGCQPLRRSRFQPSTGAWLPGGDQPNAPLNFQPEGFASRIAVGIVSYLARMT